MERVDQTRNTSQMLQLLKGLELAACQPIRLGIVAIRTVVQMQNDLVASPNMLATIHAMKPLTAWTLTSITKNPLGPMQTKSISSGIARSLTALGTLESTIQRLFGAPWLRSFESTCSTAIRSLSLTHSPQGTWSTRIFLQPKIHKVMTQVAGTATADATISSHLLVRYMPLNSSSAAANGATMP